MTLISSSQPYDADFFVTSQWDVSAEGGFPGALFGGEVYGLYIHAEGGEEDGHAYIKAIVGLVEDGEAGEVVHIT